MDRETNAYSIAQLVCLLATTMHELAFRLGIMVPAIDLVWEQQGSAYRTEINEGQTLNQAMQYIEPSTDTGEEWCPRDTRIPDGAGPREPNIPPPGFGGCQEVAASSDSGHSIPLWRCDAPAHETADDSDAPGHRLISRKRPMTL